MSIHIHELKPYKLYSSNNKLYLPLNEDSNKKGSAVILLTPNLESSIGVINSKTFINRAWFQSYYLEKSINTILTQENYIQSFVDSTDRFLDYIFVEAKLPSDKRNKLDDKQFGIPSKRKYPLNDEAHVRAAVRMFNHVHPEDEKTLARNIVKAIKKYNITDLEVGENNRFHKYYHPIKEMTFDDYDIYFFKDTATITKEFKECDTLYSKEYGRGMTLKGSVNDIKILVKAYHEGENELAGFIYGRKESVSGKTLECTICVDPNEEYQEYCTNALIYGMRSHIMTNMKGKYEYATIYYDEDMTQVMTRIATKYKTLLKGEALTGIDNKKASRKSIKLVLKEETVPLEESYKVDRVSEATMTELGLQSGNEIIICDDVFNEDTVARNSAKLKQILYPERIRNQKDITAIYKAVKSQCPSIRFTYFNYPAYKMKNLYVDTSYYNKAFFENKNNTFVNDKAVDLYYDLIGRLLNNKAFVNSGYTKKTLVIPVIDWNKKNGDILDYRENINPISIMIRLLRTNKVGKLRTLFGDMDTIFLGATGYFKINFQNFDKNVMSKFMNNIRTLISKAPIEDDEMVQDTPDAIVTDIVDKLEKSQGIQMYALTGTKGASNKSSLSGLANKLARLPESPKDEKKETPKKETTPKPVEKKEEPKKTETTVKATTKTTTPKEDKEKVVPKEVGPAKSDKQAETEDTLQKKVKVAKAIADAASTSTSTDEAIEKLNNDEYIANLIKDIADEESNGVKVSSARTARINTLNDNFKTQSVKGKSVKELIEKSQDTELEEELPKTSLSINSINKDQWSNLQYINFNKEYDVDEDIMAILSFFGTRTVPVAVRDVNVEDTSTSEDLIETWTAHMEDIHGTRFTLKFDIPKFINNRFMRLRGNDKAINAQLMNLPIIKTEKDVCQITTNYNKIFFRVYGSSLGKSNLYADKICKTLNKLEGKHINVKLGNNYIGSLKYDLPIDYIDLGTNYSMLSYKHYTFYFDQDVIREKYKDKLDLKQGTPIGYDSLKGEIIYHPNTNVICTQMIADYLCQCPEFKEIYDECKASVRYSYSDASIMTTTIPVVVICCYCEGLTKTLSKANIEYRISETRSYDRATEDIIKFSDAYLIYKINYSSSMLMNGLKGVPTDTYSIKDINTKQMWTEALDLYGGRIKADGLDNFYDLMFDPISKRTCEAYDIPSDFCSALIYASNMLVDSKYNKHTDITGNRFRTNELVAGYTYKALAKAYAEYRTRLKKTGKGNMSLKQSAIIDLILLDNTTGDASTINDLCYAEAANTVSFKGLSGMNSERSYSLDKRTFDDSMNGILGMSTGFASTVGTVRQTTVNANVAGKRGYIKDTAGNTEIMNDVNTMAMNEALVPGCTTHDDPFRLAMSFTQRTKHGMRVQGGDPLLVTNGADDALANFTPDVFSVCAKQDGKIVERTDEYIVVKYKDGSIDYVELRNKVYKNSDGGFYASVKLKASDKLGGTVKAGQVIAYDPLSYDQHMGYDDNPTYIQGALLKVGIMTTDEGFEDSTAVSSYVCEALSSDIITQVDINLEKGTNVFNLVKIGQPIQEGDPLLVIQNSYEDDDVNTLLKNLVDDEETVTSLGRIPIKSHNTGYIEDIKMYRTCEISELSPSLQKIVKEYEKKQGEIRKTIEKYDKVKAQSYTNDQKLSNTGKLKGLESGVLIEVYVRYKDDFATGDKLIALGAQKGVCKEVFPKGKEPKSEYRPDEPIDVLFSMRSFDARMCATPLLHGMANKFLVELDRQVKDIMGIKQDYTVHRKDIEDKLK
jgi:hypothetical protein